MATAVRTFGLLLRTAGFHVNGRGHAYQFSRPSKARAIVAYVAADHLTWPAKEVATAIADATSSSAVALARLRGAALPAARVVTPADILAVSRQR